MKLNRIGYQMYRIATGPAAGTIIEHSTNPRALQCYSWMVTSGVRPTGIAGYTLRGLATACERAATGFLVTKGA